MINIITALQLLESQCRHSTYMTACYFDIEAEETYRVALQNWGLIFSPMKRLVSGTFSNNPGLSTRQSSHQAPGVCYQMHA